MKLTGLAAIGGFVAVAVGVGLVLSAVFPAVEAGDPPAITTTTTSHRDWVESGFEVTWDGDRLRCSWVRYGEDMFPEEFGSCDPEPLVEGERDGDR